jgi:hypothetical protein
MSCCMGVHHEISDRRNIENELINQLVRLSATGHGCNFLSFFLSSEIKMAPKKLQRHTVQNFSSLLWLWAGELAKEYGGPWKRACVRIAVSAMDGV